MQLFNGWRRWALATLAVVGIGTVGIAPALAVVNRVGIFSDVDSKFVDSADLWLGNGSGPRDDTTQGDARFNFDGTDLNLLAQANNTLFNWGNGTTSFDWKLFGSSSSLYWSWDASANDLKAEDSVSLMFGTGGGAGMGNAGDVEMRWDGTDFDVLAAANNAVIKWGNGTNSFDQWLYGSSSSNYLLWDASADDLFFRDSVSAKFGNDGDVEIRWDGTDLDVLVATDDYIIKWGNGTQSADQWFFGNDANSYFSWDASANDLKFEDSASLMFGTGGGAGPGNAGDAELRWDGTDLDLLAAANNAVFKIGNGTNSWDLWLLGATDSTYVLWDASANDLIFQDNTSLMLGTGSDVELRWDGTDLDILAAANNSIIKFGNGTNDFDLWFYGSTADSYISWDASANDLKFEDSVSAMFGTGAGAGPGNAGDVELRWDGTDLDLLAAVNNTIFKIGDGTTDFDIWLYGSGANNYVSFDASGNDLKFEDSMSVMFGTGADAGPGTAGDVEIRWDATDLDILAAADDLVIKIGNGTNSFDAWLYGNAAADYILWDASAGQLSTQGDAYIQLNDFRRNVVAKTAAYTVAATDSGTVFTTTDATAAVTFTLPATGTTGLEYKFCATAAQNLTITAPTDELVTYNNVNATGIVFSTANAIVGNCATIYSDATQYIAAVDLASDSALTVTD